MKKIAIFFLIIIIIVVGMSYLYLNYKASYNQAKQKNKQFESYYNEDVYGTDLVTVINKAVDNNLSNEVEKNQKGFFQNNKINSINIDIKIIDNDTVYKMETIYNSGIDNFVQYYGQIKFKCTKIEYHKDTGKIKYLLFEQITQ